jgi:hypothetical protein
MERQLSTSQQRDYSQPFSWWGYRSSPEQPTSIIELINRGALDTRLAAFLWLALEQRSSLFVTATPPEAGKTTMLTALLDFLPEDVELIYLRGWYERFSFLDEGRDPSTFYLLSNEISSHLPTYLWGRGVRRLFEAADAGYSMAATVHADGAREVLDLLARYPLEVPRAHLAHVKLVLTLSYRRVKEKQLRRVTRLESVEAAAGGPEIRMLAERDVVIGELQSPPGRLIAALCHLYGLEREYAAAQFARREAFLERLLKGGMLDIADVRSELRRVAQNDSD